MARKYQKAAIKYQKTAKEYADLYGVSEITVKRWKAKGWPLDDEMATRALIEGKKPTFAAPGLPPSSAALGITAATERLREAEAAAHSAYLGALQGGDESAANQRAKTWLVLTDQLRKLEESAPDVNEANKKSVQLGELQNALNELFRKLRQDLETLSRRTALELVGKDEIAIREIIDREAEEIIKNLYTCKYLGVGDAG